MRPYRATIKTDKAETEIYYWSDSPVNTKKNTEAAGRAYVKKYGYPKTLNVLRTKRITYAELPRDEVVIVDGLVDELNEKLGGALVTDEVKGTEEVERSNE